MHPAVSSWIARTREEPSMSQSNSVRPHVDLQIMWNRLIAVVEEQAQTLMRTASARSCANAAISPPVCSNLEGRMLAQAVNGTPGHVNSNGQSVKHFCAIFRSPLHEAGRAYINQRSGWAPAISTTSSSPRRASATASWWRCSPAPAISWTSAASASAGRHRRVHGGPLHPDAEAVRRAR